MNYNAWLLDQIGEFLTLIDHDPASYLRHAAALAGLYANAVGVTKHSTGGNTKTVVNTDTATTALNCGPSAQ